MTSWDSGWSTFAGRVVARVHLPRTDTRPTGPALGSWGWGCRGIRRTAPGRAHPSSSWLPELLGWGKHRTQAQLSLSWWSTQKPESERLRPGKCMQLRARSLESSLEPEQCRWGKHSLQAGANPVWPEHCQCSPHMPVTFVCSAPPSPQHHANLNKRPPPPTCLRAEIRHWRDLQTEAEETKGTTSAGTGATD